MSTGARARSRDPIYGLDLIRFLAAIMVTVFHFGFRLFDGSGFARHYVYLPAGLPAWWVVSWFGWVGVQVFFVISGLVIAYSLEGASRAHFARSRVARLLPAMLICATVSAVVEVAVYHGPPAQVATLWLRSVLFFPNGPWIAAQIWTLPIEIVFYLIVLLVVVGRPRRIEALAWLLAVASAAFWLSMVFGLVPLSHGRLTQLVPLQHGCFFALGISLAGWNRRQVSWSLIALAVLSLATSVLQVRIAAQAEHLPFGVAVYWPVAWGVFFLAVVGIAASMRWKARIAPAVSPMAARVLRLTGLLTYPLYLVHFPLGCAVMLAAGRAGAPVAVEVVLATLVSVAAAAIIAQWLEPPVHRVVKRALGGRR